MELVHLWNEPYMLCSHVRNWKSGICASKNFHPVFPSDVIKPYMPQPIWAYLMTGTGGRGGAYLPPYVFWVWFGLGFQFFLEMPCLIVIYHIQKISWSLDDQNPLKKWLTFQIFHWLERPPTQFVWSSVISNELHLFRQHEIAYGVKSILPFSKLINRNSQVFSTCLYVYLQRSTQIRGRAGIYPPPPPPPPPVLIGLS